MCPLSPKSLFLDINSLTQWLPLDSFLSLYLHSQYSSYLLACKLQPHRDIQNEQAEQLSCGNMPLPCARLISSLSSRRRQTTTSFSGPLLVVCQTARARLDSVLSAGACRSSLVCSKITSCQYDIQGKTKNQPLIIALPQREDTAQEMRGSPQKGDLQFPLCGDSLERQKGGSKVRDLPHSSTMLCQ